MEGSYTVVSPLTPLLMPTISDDDDLRRTNMNNNDLFSCEQTQQHQQQQQQHQYLFEFSPLNQQQHLATFDLLFDDAGREEESFVSNTTSEFDAQTITDILDGSIFTCDNALVFSPLTPPVDVKQEKPFQQQQSSLIERPVPCLILPKQIRQITQSVTGGKMAEVATIREDCGSDSSSSWKIVLIDHDIVKDDGSTKITIGSRKCSFNTEQVEPQLYSCISYDMKHEAFGSFLQDLATTQRVVLVRVEVIDSKTKQEVRKNNKTILSSNPVGVLSKDLNGGYYSDMKVKFNSCSYHFDRACFQFRVSYSFQNSDRPFLVKESSEFLIYARKASNAASGNTNTSATKKRKRSTSSSGPSKNSRRVDQEGAITEEQSSKRTKLSHDNNNTESQSLTVFSNSLSNLFSCFSTLSQEERKQAVSLLATQVENCPHFPKSLLNE